MKKSVSKICALQISVLLLLFFSGCEKDLYENPSHGKEAIVSERISIEKLLTEIENPLIKEKIATDIKPNLDLSASRSLYDFIFFNKITKENECVTYALLINGYSVEKPYFLYFVITKTQEGEKAGYTKYIPNQAIAELDPASFDGKIQVMDIEENVKGEDDFEDGQPVPRMSSSVSCTNQITLMVFNCTQGGNHAPGDNSCINNNGYYQIIVTQVCYQQYSLVAAPETVLGEPGMGGTGLSPEDLALFQFLTQLGEHEKEILVNSPGLIEYLRNNEVSQASQEFVVQLIGICIATNSTVTLDNSITLPNALNFQNTSDFQDFLTTLDVDGSDFELEQDQLQKIAKLKIQMVGPFGGVEIKIKQTMPPYTISEVSSSEYGFTAAFGWEQTSYNYNSNNNVVTINVLGNIHYNCVVEGIGTVWTSPKKYQIKINKSTGAIISAVKID